MKQSVELGIEVLIGILTLYENVTRLVMPVFGKTAEIKSDKTGPDIVSR